MGYLPDKESMIRHHGGFQAYLLLDLLEIRNTRTLGADIWSNDGYKRMV